MPKQEYTASEAATALGISVDTLRRWDRRAGSRSSATAATGASSRRHEIDRLRGDGKGTHISARNRFRATVTDVKVEGLMAQVELVVTDPVRLVAIVTRDAVEELGLKEGMAATAIVKSTNVIIQS